MPQSNNAKTELVISNINERIARENQIIGFNTTSVLQARIDETNSLIDAYNPAIKGIDAKIVSIGQSINQLKDEIIVLITNAVGPGTTGCYAGVNTSCGIGTTMVGMTTVTAWNGGISTCLFGYATEYYDTVTAHNWAFSKTSSNPFVSSTTILSSASNTFGVGVGTFLVVAQNNSSYSAGARVSLGSSSTCQATQTEINRKDGEIATLRTEFGKYIGVVNSIREQRWKSQLEKWGIERAQQESQTEKDRLVGVLTAFTDSFYTNLFLR